MAQDEAGSEHDWHGRLERVLFLEHEIRDRVSAMGREIEEHYRGEPLTIVGILQGGALFMADLIREIRLPLKVDAVSVSSYGSGTVSSGKVTFHQSRLPALEGRHVLIVDDILDSGRTLRAIADRFSDEAAPLSIRTAVLLSKRVARAVDIEADYRGFEVENEFVVGYGLDYDGEYRNLREIGVLHPEWIRSGEPEET